MSLAGTAQETLAILDAGGYAAPSGAWRDLRAAIDGAVAGTRLYRPGALDAVLAGAGDGPLPRVDVTAETTAAAARRLAREGLRVAALNFASARNPGGGFLGGARAQEEDLARASALYPCLLAQPEYYDVNRACPSMLYTDHLIYSPAVPFFRGDDRRLLEEPFACGIITAPAPNAGQALLRDGAAGPAITRTLRARASLVLAAAAAEGERHLVLGAWGCGVFRNDPDEVAALFAEALRAPAFAGRFDRVVFAIHDRSPGRTTLAAFERRLGPAQAG